MVFAQGQQIGQYTIVGQVGYGGMATIYKAYHARLDRHVAIKVMHNSFAEDASFLARFEREARIVAKLEHPNIVSIYDFAEHEGRPYLVMRFIEGSSLKQVYERGSLTLKELLRILPPLASALDYAHKSGVLHRDIKPSNILLASDGTPYLTDFGLARVAVAQSLSLTGGAPLGTPYYLSPEQAQGQRNPTGATDIYSFGVVLYELVTGRVPFGGETLVEVVLGHVQKPLTPASRFNPQVTAQLDAVFAKALAKQPAERYATTTELVQAFTEAARAARLTELPPKFVGDPLSGADSDEDYPASAPAQIGDETPAIFDPFDHAQTARLDTPPPARSAPPIQAESPGARIGAQVGATVGAALEAAANAAAQAMRDVGKPSRPDSSADKPAEKPKRESEQPASDASKRWEAQGQNWSHSIQKGIESFAQDIAERNESAHGLHAVYSDPNDERVIELRVASRVRKKREWRDHLIVYIVINVCIAVLFSALGIPFVSGIVLLGWGAGLLADTVEMYFDTGGQAQLRLRRVHDAFRQAYGVYWWEHAPREELKRIRRRIEQPVKKRIEFYQHLAVYSMIIPLLWFIWATFMADAFPWPVLATVLWGLGVVGNAVEVFGTKVNQQLLQREIERERLALSGQEKAKRDAYPYDFDDADAAVRLNADGEFTDSFVDEVAQEQRRRR
jgi:serine/threonine protein kinase